MTVIYLRAESEAALISALVDAGMWQTEDVYEWTDPVLELVLERPLTEQEEEGEGVDFSIMPEGADFGSAEGGIVSYWRTITPSEKVKTGTRSFFKGLQAGDALDTIGTIYRGTGQFSEVEGEQIEQVEAVEGFHANLLLHGDVPEALAAITIPEPASPRRVFAGFESNYGRNHG